MLQASRGRKCKPFYFAFSIPAPPPCQSRVPHKGTHLVVGGGVDVSGKGDVDVIEGATGDMGENGTASFDPFFFFHHAFIDCVFGSGNRSTTRPLA